MLFSCLGVMPVYADEIPVCGGWFEAIYAEWNDSNVSGAIVEYKEHTASEYSIVDSQLIRDYDGKGRVDIVGIKEGNYDIKITAGNGTVLTKENITVKPHDRTGYAHHNYSQGVGAYNNDGTPKDNALIIYVTNENKDTIKVSGADETGIGWLLNNNRNFMEKLAKEGRPLIVRFIGKIDPPQGLTGFNSTENGGTVGDNGNMCIIKSSKNVTLEGIGYDADINGWGISFYVGMGYQNKESYEVRNLHFGNYPEDALGFQGYQEGSTAAKAKLTDPIERVWVHNCSFDVGHCDNPLESDKKEGDGSCDFKRGMYYTMDYNYYEGCHKTNLVGASGANLQYNMTFHHNYYVDCGARQPLIRQANLHMYNSYFKLTPSGKGSYIISSRAGSYVFSEANFYDSCKNPVELKAESGVSEGAVKSYNDVFYNTSGTNRAVIVKDRNEEVESACKYKNFDTQTDFYNYNVTSAAQAKADCMAFSGVMKKPEEIVEDPQPEQIISNVPENAISLPFSVTFDDASAADYFGKTLTDKNITLQIGKGTEVDNVIYKPAKEYKNTGTVYTVKDGGITFKIDRKSVVGIGSSGGKVAAAMYGSDGNVLLSVQNAVRYVVLEPGVYMIQSASTDKEANISSLTIKEYTSDSDVPQDETQSTTENTESTSEDDIQSSTEKEDEGGKDDVVDDNESVHICNFTKEENTNRFFDISGSVTKKTDYTAIYNGEELIKYLKMDSKANVGFKTSDKAKLTLVTRSTKTEAKIKIDGKSVVVSKDGGVTEIDIEPGVHSILKDTETFIFYIKVSEESSEPSTESGSGEGSETTTENVPSEFVYNGDVTGDGSFDVDDAAAILQYVLDKKNAPQNIGAAKIKEDDGEITAVHAAYALKAVLESWNNIHK